MGAGDHCRCSRTRGGRLRVVRVIPERKNALEGLGRRQKGVCSQIPGGSNGNSGQIVKIPTLGPFLTGFVPLTHLIRERSLERSRENKFPAVASLNAVIKPVRERKTLGRFTQDS